MSDVPAVVQPYQRMAWQPLTIAADGARTASKFAGLPWLAADEAWPLCPNCGKPIQLLLQLSLADLPQALGSEYGVGLLQMFYCTTDEPLCDVDCQAWEPFSRSTLVRVIESVGAVLPLTESPVADAFPPLLIVDWLAAIDYPNAEESELLGVELSAAESEQLYAADYPLSKDKLAGWPAWVQGVEYPHCPQCAQPMRLLFQLDSHDHLPYTFGDVGTGHITQCPVHLTQVAFGWACG